MTDEWNRNYRARKRVSDQVRARGEPCCLCHEPIDYTLAYPNLLSFSVQHVQPRKLRPDLMFDPTNCRAAHLTCNASDGSSKTKITTAVTTRRW